MARRDFIRLRDQEELEEDLSHALLDWEDAAYFTFTQNGSALSPSTPQDLTLVLKRNGVTIRTVQARATPSGTNLSVSIISNAGSEPVTVNTVGNNSQFVTVHCTHTASQKASRIVFLVLNIDTGSTGK